MDIPLNIFAGIPKQAPVERMTLDNVEVGNGWLTYVEPNDTEFLEAL
jgi:hypothetical protein